MSESSNVSQLPTIVIEPSAGWVSLKLREVWDYRELLYFLIWRDIKVRYKQTVLGAAWAVLQPLLTMLVFSIIFGRLAKVPSDGIAYPLFAFTALLPWQLFAHALNDSANSLVTNQQLITKVYFPRLVIPMGAVLAGLIDFAVGFVVLLGMMVYYRTFPHWTMLMLPLFLILTLVVALAVGLWLSALNVRYRDVRHTIPFLTQFWLFVTPIAYSSSLIPERWRWCCGLNPMAGAVEGFRWTLLGSTRGGISVIALSVFVACLLLVGGLFYFRRMERTFSDII